MQRNNFVYWIFGFIVGVVGYNLLYGLGILIGGGSRAMVSEVTKLSFIGTNELMGYCIYHVGFLRGKIILEVILLMLIILLLLILSKMYLRFNEDYKMREEKDE